MGASGWTAFWKVTAPLAFPSLLTGAAMCWARALGEFGATIMFAGSFQGRTQTMPLAIYAALESDLDAALARNVSQKHAMEMLLTMLAGEEPKSREMLLRAELIVRNSVSRPGNN